MRLVKPSYTTLNKATGKRETRYSRKWYVIFRDHNGNEVKKPAFADRLASEAYGIDLERQAERIKAGVLPPEVLETPRTIDQHIDAFRKSLDTQQTTEKHRNLTIFRVKATLEEAKIKHVRRIDPETIRQAISIMMKREVKPISAQTACHYSAAMIQFCGFLQKTKVLPTNPLTGRKEWDAEQDRKRVRRVITDAEFNRLIDKTFRSKAVKEFDGKHRATLYMTAAYSGFRASELASLTVSQVIERDGVVLISIDAKKAKNRKGDSIPLPDCVGEALLKLIKGKKPDETIWPGKWAEHNRSAEMLRVDLAAAKIPYLLHGKYYDFHSLRSQYATNLVRNGVPISHAQRLMRHSTPALTMKVYAQLGFGDLADEVAKLNRKQG